jgi:hypothetical protein
VQLALEPEDGASGRVFNHFMFFREPKARPEKEAVLRPIPCVQEVEKFLILMEL